MDVFLILLLGMISFLVGGIIGRSRGAGTITIGKVKIVIPDWVARFGIWGIPVGIVILLVTSNLAYADIGVILAGAGASAGYRGSFDLTTDANKTLSNYAKLTVMGCFRFFPLLVGAAYVGLEWRVLPAVVAGIAFVPAYLLGIKIAATGFKLPLLTSFSEWGEFLFWGAIFAAFVAGLTL